MANVDEDAYQRVKERALEGITNAKNRATLEDYVDERRINDITVGTLANDLNVIGRLAEHLKDKPFEEAVKKDLKAFFEKQTQTRVWRSRRKDGTVVERKRTVPLKRTTLLLRKQIVKTFYKTLFGLEDGYPECVRWLKTARRRSDRIPTDELIARKDLECMLAGARDARERAYVALQGDSGARPGELCSVRLRHVEFDPDPKFGVVIMMPTHTPGLKTGARRLQLFDCAEYVRAWIEEHPFRDDPDAPLLLSNSLRAPWARMNPKALTGFFKRLAKRVGVTKNVTCRLFRHTAATERARLGWQESELRNFFGWSPDSDMPSVYVHLAGKDYAEMDMIRRGLKGPGETGQPALTPRTCGVCGAKNFLEAMFCHACQRPISPFAQERMEAKRVETAEATIAGLLERRVQEAIDERLNDLLAEPGMPTDVTAAIVEALSNGSPADATKHREAAKETPPGPSRRSPGGNGAHGGGRRWSAWAKRQRSRR